MFMRVLPIGLCFLAAFGAPALADPGDVIGSTVTVVNQVTGEFKTNVRNLTTGDDVVQEEIIAVGLDSVGELMLRDETKVALGPGARLVLDRFVYDPDKTSGAIVLDLIKGGFRFITGVAAKPLYVIRTPTASVTVRGTIFDVYIEESGAIWLLLIEGSIRASNGRGQHHDLDDPCRVLRIGPGGDFDDPGTWNALPTAREVSFETAFPFVVKPPEVDPTPIFTRDDIELGRCPEAKVRKAKLIEPEEPGPRRKAHKTRKPKYAHVRRRRYPRYVRPRGPSIGISIGIGIGGGRGGGGGGGHHQ
jgi:hypothetical protein